MHPFVEKGAAPALDLVDVPALPEVWLQAVGMAMTNADEVDAPEPALVDDLL